MGNEEQNFDEVGNLLGTLKRVEPPGDFDVRVRSRIAQGRPASGRSWPLVLARIGVPAALLMVLGAYFGWNTLNQPVNVPVVVDVQQQPHPVQPPVESPSTGGAVEPEQFLASREPEVPGNSSPANPGLRPNSNVKPAPDAGIESEDFTVTPTRRILPRGLNPNGMITNANVGSNARQSAVQVLAMLGVSASCSAAGCRVNSVSPSSVGGNSGLRAGDVIEALDGRPIGSNTTFNGQFSAGSVRIRRDGSLMTVALRP